MLKRVLYKENRAYCQIKAVPDTKFDTFDNVRNETPLRFIFYSVLKQVYDYRKTSSLVHAVEPSVYFRTRNKI